MKIVWFVVGGAFFFCWPIASRYPKYRYLVSPIKWVLWDIPTDGESSCDLDTPDNVLTPCQPNGHFNIYEDKPSSSESG